MLMAWDDSTTKQEQQRERVSEREGAARDEEMK